MGHRRLTTRFPVRPRRGQPWVAAGFNLRLAEPNGPFNPDGVDRGKGRPLQGRIPFSPPVSVGFTYGYSRCPASREGRRRIVAWIILAPMGGTARRVRGFFAGDAFMATEVSGARDFDGTPDLGLFACPIPWRQPHYVNRDGARRCRRPALLAEHYTPRSRLECGSGFRQLGRISRPALEPLRGCRRGGALQAAEKLESPVILRSSGDEESRIALKMLRPRSFA